MVSKRAPEEYVAPTGDEPLDARELALAKALTAIIVRQIREEAVTTQAQPVAPTGNRAG
jgi:hypothetical protein